MAGRPRGWNETAIPGNLARVAEATSAARQSPRSIETLRGTAPGILVAFLPKRDSKKLAALAVQDDASSPSVSGSNCDSNSPLHIHFRGWQQSSCCSFSAPQALRPGPWKPDGVSDPVLGLM